MHKTIVPKLVSMHTNRAKIKGSYLFYRLDFFNDTNSKLPLHYTLQEDNHIAIPTKHDFRNGYYKKLGDTWYYERNLKGLLLAFTYNQATKTFTYNKWYKHIPFEIGGIQPFGKHISDIMAIDMLLKGVFVVRGYGYKLGNGVVCGIAPSFNGKTTLVGNMLKKGGKYIAEDMLAINFITNTVYPTVALHANFGRKANAQTHALARHQSVTKPHFISRLHLYHTSTAEPSERTKHSLTEYVHMNSQLFMGNIFARAYIFHNQLQPLLQQRMSVLTDYNRIYKTVTYKGISPHAK